MEGTGARRRLSHSFMNIESVTNVVLKVHCTPSDKTSQVLRCGYAYIVSLNNCTSLSTGCMTLHGHDHIVALYAVNKRNSSYLSIDLFNFCTATCLIS